MQKMFGLQPNDIVAISEDGAPRNQRDFLVWSPPLIDPSQPALGKASSIAEATGLMRFLMKRGIRVILFCKVSSAFLSSIKFPDESYVDSKSLRIGEMRLSKTAFPSPGSPYPSRFIQATKTLKADLSNEGRFDILKRVRPYRGGQSAYILSLFCP